MSYYMSAAEQIAFKNTLKQFCQETIGQRMDAAKEAMKAAQEAANNEEKSSAGDKYETGRAMGHLQKDMYARQLAAYAKELSALYTINTEAVYKTVQAGCYVETPGICFFIAAGLGKQQFADKTILFLSPFAPLARALENKGEGDEFVFNGRTLTVTNLF